MRDLPYNPVQEEVVDILATRTGNDDRRFLRISAIYALGRMAGIMRAVLDTRDQGVIPVNVYGLNLAPSGYGKNRSVAFLEEVLLAPFDRRYLGATHPFVMKRSLAQLAEDRSLVTGNSEDVEEENAETEYRELGPMVLGFDSATVPAAKQFRTKLLMGRTGALNLVIDEIGANLAGNIDILNLYLELYDMGLSKAKLTKITKDAKRIADIPGRTPANLLLFGTPGRLFDGAATEDAFTDLLLSGYARRLFYHYTETPRPPTTLSPEALYARLADKSESERVTRLADRFAALADVSAHGRFLAVPEKVAVNAIAYRIDCEHRARDASCELKKTELAHRASKMLKLAGVYAFVEGRSTLLSRHVDEAIRLTEDSGQAFEKMTRRERPYMRLARHLAAASGPLTQAELEEDLPCYRGSLRRKAELMELAISWGHTHQITIAKSQLGEITLFEGSTLAPVDLDHVRISWSTRITEDYRNTTCRFIDLPKLTGKPGYHFITHHVEDGYRDEQHITPGCDLVVIDIDGGVTVEAATRLLSAYRFLLYTTKRHDANATHRFRLIFPLDYRLHLSREDFPLFMKAVFDWLPFPVLDDATGQRSRKWLSHPGRHVMSNGTRSLDARRFIPRTRAFEKMTKILTDQAALSRLERWFVAHATEGNRNNQLLRYALLLSDQNETVEAIEARVTALNDRLSPKLARQELEQTIFKTIRQRRNP